MCEVWKSILGYENYEVSNMGNVRSLDRYITRAIAKGGGLQKCKGRLLKWVISTHKYPRASVQLSKKGHSKRYSVHGLVMIAFVGNPPPDNEINHKNGKALDNKLSNLEYCTHKENAIHAYKSGLICPPSFRGENHGMAKLNDEEVQQIRNMRQTTSLTIREIAKMYKVSKSLIGAIENRKVWRHIL